MMFDMRKTDIMSRQDKSIKASLDPAVAPLVDALNAKQNFYTTSSCAGRIVLLKRPSDSKHDAEWLLASHEKVSFKQVKEALVPGPYPVWFKAESPILHICARTIDDAQDFLTLAKEAGFKRTGLISAKNRIIIECMATNRIDTLVARDSCVLVTDEYLNVLVEEGNVTLERNWEALKALRSRCEHSLT